MMRQKNMVERTSGTDDSPVNIDQGHDEEVLLWVEVVLKVVVSGGGLFEEDYPGGLSLLIDHGCQ